MTTMQERVSELEAMNKLLKDDIQELIGLNGHHVEMIAGVEAERDRYVGEVKRLRGVIRGISEPGSEEECKLCWEKKDILRNGLYPKEKQEGR